MSYKMSNFEIIIPLQHSSREAEDSTGRSLVA